MEFMYSRTLLGLLCLEIELDLDSIGGYLNEGSPMTWKISRSNFLFYPLPLRMKYLAVMYLTFDEAGWADCRRLVALTGAKQRHRKLPADVNIHFKVPVGI